MTGPRANPSELRNIPSVNELLYAIQSEPWTSQFSRGQITTAIREELDVVRLNLVHLGGQAPALVSLVTRVQDRLKNMTAISLRSVINATGIIVHTNLGRAPMSEEAVRRVAEISSGYSNLEFDLDSGSRGSRDKHLEHLFAQILPAEASLVVNNNASALMLILNTLAEGKEVIVSRGELVEIGGSFRLPDIMKKSQAILREVGTTNKTRLEDYRAAINYRTGLILVVHPSNFQIIGFTEKPRAEELIALGAEQGIPVMEDHGAGILADLAPHGISEEPIAAERLNTGFDAICFSGDKILGGPQAGIICGKKKYVDAMRKNSLFRVLRVDKMVYAALEATLRLYLTQRENEIPVLRMLSTPEAELHKRAEHWLQEIRTAAPELIPQVEPTICYVGGGVAPMKGLDSCAVSIRHPKLSAQHIADALRKNNPPIVARIEGDLVFLEMRTLTESDRPIILRALTNISG